MFPPSLFLRSFVFFLALSPVVSWACTCGDVDMKEVFFGVNHIMVVEITGTVERNDREWATFRLVEDIKNGAAAEKSFPWSDSAACGFSKLPAGTVMLLVGDGGEEGYSYCTGSGVLRKPDGSLVDFAEHIEQRLQTFRGIASGEIKRDWYRDAEPTEDAARLLNNGDSPHFYMLAGESYHVPGVGLRTAAVCFREVTSLNLGPYLDASATQEEKKMYEAAFIYAEAFNRYVADSRQVKREASCGPDEDWDKAHAEIDTYLASSHSDARVSETGANRNREIDVYTDSARLNLPAAMEICRILDQNNIADAVIDNTWFNGPSSTDWVDTEYSCRGGEAAMKSAE